MRVAALRGLAFVATIPMSVGILVAAASPAAADITDPVAGATYDSETTVYIRAEIPKSTTTTDLRMHVPGEPAANERLLARRGPSSEAGILRYNFDTGCATFPTCSGRAPARNGTYQLTLSGGTSHRTTFVLRIPPRPPTSVQARTTAYREITITWQKGDEPDLTGFLLTTGDETVIKQLGLDACSGTDCRTTVGYNQDEFGERSFAVKALRSTAPGSTENIASSRSAVASSQLEAPPPPPPPPPSSAEPSPTPSSGGSGSGSTGSGSGSGGGPPITGGGSGTGSGSGSGSGSGASGGGRTTGPITNTGGGNVGGITASAGNRAALAQRTAFGLTFRAFGPKLGIAKLPPLPQTSAPVVAGAPEPDGTFEETLSYEDQIITERVSVPQSASARVSRAVGHALDSDQLWKSLAGALILLLVGAHLRRWLAVPVEDR
ncbi:MAG TPA: hypothetical protein VNA30_02570 [Mycobacteriales bacterium]|nr:hypothetical protein [Mycobacteriales bacterium]